MRCSLSSTFRILAHLSLLSIVLSASSAAAARVVTAEAHAACDACRTLVERFTLGWEDVIRDQAHGGKADNKANSVPAITYNQEIEDYLQGFCNSDYIAPPFSAAIRKGCSSIMDVHKREVVATFLSVSEQIGSHGKTTRGPTRLRRICDGLASSCNHAYVRCRVSPGTEAERTRDFLCRYTNVTKLSKCEACHRVVADAHFMLRRRVTPAHALSSIEATDALESLCSDAYRRYDDSPRLVEKVCEDVMEEHVMKLLKVRPWCWGLLLLVLMMVLLLL